MQEPEKGNPIPRSSERPAGFLAIALVPFVVLLIFTPFYDSIGVPDDQNTLTLMDWQRVSEMLTMSLVLVILGVHACLRLPVAFLFPSFQVSGWFVFFLIGGVSCVYAAFPRFAWIEWSWLFVCFASMVLISKSAERDFDSVRATVRLWVLYALVSYTALYYIRNSDYLFEEPSIFGPILFGFYNVRVFSDYQSALICLLPWALRNASSSKAVRVGAWGISGCYVALAFVVGSRSLLFGQLSAAITIWMFLGRKQSVDYLSGQVRLWLIAIFAYVLLFVLFPLLIFDGGGQAIPSFRLRYDGSGRMVLWDLALQMGLAHPWLGVGPMHYAATPNPFAASPHNQVLQVFAEFGVVAAVLSVVLLGDWLFGVRRKMQTTLMKMDESDRLFSISLFAALLALLAQSCVSPVFNNPQSQVLVVFLGGLLGSSVQWPAGSRMVPVPRSLFVLSAFVALCVFVASCLPWSLRLEERNACYFSNDDRPTAHLAPRFWQQGWLFIPCEPVF